ncbi:MAG TPA: choice-of-anchor tandem repeat GloVer-containing protein [Terriglobales bacterium]|nr:choice-of-anchor tandem repeat GloVer-containing protein [Terriglobales bacterium]
MRPIRLARLGKLNWRSKACFLLLLCLTAITLPAQTFTILHNFNGTDGAYVLGGLVQTTNGSLYGTTDVGGAGGNGGTVFKISTSGTLTSLHTFSSSGPDEGPYGGLIQATNGNLYGTTQNFGTYHDGTVFKITLSGMLTTLHSFDSTDGTDPSARLVQAANGSFYGTTYIGGAYDWGTVFKMTSSGTLTTLHHFAAGTDGAEPAAGLTQAIDGNLYGTAANEGASGWGTVFMINPKNGKFTVLHGFDGTDGGEPYGDLVQSTDGNLYGTTISAGTYGYGTVFKFNPTSGKLTTLFDFDNGADGGWPYGGVIEATDGNLYGTTNIGGAYGQGTIFKIVPTSGFLTTLYNFGSTITDGANPYSPLVQDTDGTFYGTTSDGGTSGDGTVFSLSVGLGPFVETQTTSGKVGAAVKILGTNLTGATNVTFGTPAVFKVASSSLITTTVPNGATTGSVSVTTPDGTLYGNQQFRVLPQITSFTPPSGPVGTSVKITGVSLTQTLKITFGGVNAPSFLVNSDTQVTVTVPAGAKTGKIAITTAGGGATSSGTFTVT